MPLQMNKIVLAFSFIVAKTLTAAPYYCGVNGGVYADQTFCSAACGSTCQSIQTSASGSSGACDATNFDGFVYVGNKTFAISKTSLFWDGFSNLAQPTSAVENSILRGIVANYGGNAWIGVYDPLLSSSFNVVDTTNFIYADGTALKYSNWLAGQPDNRNDNADIGAVSINGEHWAYMQSDGLWADDGYHVVYGGNFKPTKRGVVEWRGALDCVNGVNLDQTSGSSGLWCNDVSGNLAQCTSTTDYTAKTGSSYTYAATAGVGPLVWDNCEGGPRLKRDGDLYCASKGMRLPTINESKAKGGSVPSCANGYKGWTWSSSVYMAGSWWAWSDTNTMDRSNVQWCGDDGCGYMDFGDQIGIRCVKNTIAYTCPNGGTLSGTTCTVNTLACPTGYTETTGAETANGECKKTGTPACPLGDYQCVDITGSVQNSDTVQGAADKKDNGATDSSGNCLGNIYIFNGNDQRCRVPGVQTGFSDCCQKGDKWFGLAKCSPKEQALGKLRDWGDLDGQCHYVGQYCSEKWPLIGCVQKKKTYCCFGSVLSRIIHEGGRPQLGISWGEADSPQCRGFTPTEFQKIDFSKIDFSEWIKYDIIPNVQNNAVGGIQNTVNNISNSFQ